MVDGPRVFDYRPHRGSTFAVFLLVLASPAVLLFVVPLIDRPVRVRGFVLSAELLRILLTILLALSPLAIAAIGAMVYDAFWGYRTIRLTGTSLILPRPTWHGLSRETIEIPDAELLEIQLIPFIGRHRLLRIMHAKGTIHVPSNMFPRRADFDDLVAALEDSLPG